MITRAYFPVETTMAIYKKTSRLGEVGRALLTKTYTPDGMVVVVVVVQRMFNTGV